MLRLRAAYEFFWRVFRLGPKTVNPLLTQINECINEEQIFDIVGKNKTKLSEKHVGYACKILWQFQKEKPDLMRNILYVRDHPQFLTLRILAKDKIELMDDDILVDVLHAMLRFAVEAHDPLIEHLVMEAWRRIERFDFKMLSKFSTCLAYQQMHFSPLMGKIADIVNRNLDSMQDLRTLSVLMVNISSVISQNFCERLVNKTELLLDTTDPLHFNSSIRIMQFLRNIRYNYLPLLEKCNHMFISNTKQLNLNTLSLILALYQSLQFNNFPFQILAREKLSKMIALYYDPASFVKLFVALGPLAGPTEEKELMLALQMVMDVLTSQQALAVVITMEEMNCKDSHLIEKIASILYKYLHVYKPVELAQITKSLIHLNLHNSEFFIILRDLLLSHLKNNVIPGEISMLVHVIATLPFPHLDELGLSRVEPILPQCSLSDLCTLASSLSKWFQYDHSYLDNIKLLPQLSAYAYRRLQKANNLNVLWEELKYVHGEWFEEELLEETILTLQRLADQITYRNITNLTTFIVKTSYLSPPMLDKVASVTIQQINKIHPLALHSILLPFSVLNYDPPQKDEFFGTCIQHLNSHLSLFEPHILVFLGFTLALSEYFPEDLIKEIFNIKFLAKLDSQLQYLPSFLNMRTHSRLMEFNRAVCLECPEFEIPWFHHDYCQQQYNKVNSSITVIQHKIYKMLGKILGGPNYVKPSALTPYGYTVDFEYILDKKKKPLPYRSQLEVLNKLSCVHWGPDTDNSRSELPPGTQRVALEFLDSRAFCKNISHLKGRSAMKKRHLEILGYRVIQIPYVVWNSMELSTKNARMEYLREHLFAEAKS
ncbi:FAST kinase domain-containing protein 1, mitochondrial [Sarcophilus harrisii]|uniref:FAST kinase domains 1 n=1 Tax=Sarcophilus harrisii TaxID=9305 RepID=G3WZR2_SARHA|nr:FAST kinase domain-containing protein 1, mitochondrial [Sarcophilus harrisii]XP_023355038.1 FAST kinase domain-containing protein 1, mitochondrial [Sarcophilus harrisii]XP_023355040.1 FAST kinase domain-containing protein 1, mitochondrial [Sarcophilus harrisii]XP_023355041.1 FAST kinase domain-containing protein 1, mitochondrial [Sarcophilus harrisii]XP_031816365.1 FAST kinase domain-containing protein 1, mitochondrial [Sarcophilus harrisii]